MIKETCCCGAHIETHMSRFQDVYKEAEIVKAWRKEQKHEVKKVKIENEPPLRSL